MWEYKKVTSHYQLMVDELNKLGEDRWELVNIIDHPNTINPQYVHYLKRVKLA